MNEHDWLTSDDPGGMLECLQGSARERKRRLFACLCCRGIWEMLDEWGRAAVEVSERWADGEASEEELAECQQFAEAQMAAVAGGEFSDEWLVAVVSAALAGDAAGAAHLAENLEAWGAYQGARAHRIVKPHTSRRNNSAANKQGDFGSCSVTPSGP